MQDEVRAALRIGAVVPPFLACVDALSAESGTPRSRRNAVALLAEVVDAPYDRWTTHALRTCSAALRAAPANAGFSEDDLGALLAKLTRIRPSAANQPGVVNALIDAGRSVAGRPVGVVRTLTVAATPWGGERRFAGEVDNALVAAFARGAGIAHRYLQEHGLRRITGSILMRSRSYAGEFVGLAEAIAGPSVGLASGVAILSSVFGVPVPADIAFTGEVLPDGRVSRVGGMPAKLQAAREMGLRAVWCPVQDSANNCSGLELHEVQTFHEVVPAVFSGASISAGIARINDESSAVQPDRRWLLAEDDSRAEIRVLVSLVGGTDPVKDGTEGNILAISTERPFDVACLLYTRDFAPQFEATRERLQARGVEVFPLEVRLPDPPDPTDFNLIYLPVRDRVLEAVALIRERWEPETTAVLVNVSSGTPQMCLLLHLFVEQEILPDRRLQVAHPKFAVGRPRVTRVILPPPME